MLTAVVLLGALCAITHAQTPVWSDSGCGKSKYSDAGNLELPSGFIVGGVEARQGEFSWQVSLRRKSSGSHFCGGSIISKNWIVTAAHCVSGQTSSSISIAVGDWRRSAASDVRQVLDVSLIKSHENYKPSTTENDVALIKVSTPIDFNDDVQPVCAPDSSKDYAWNLVQCAGWGTLRSGGPCCPDTLQYVTMNVTTKAYCQNAYWRWGYDITDDMICSTDNVGSTQRDSCQGDSGGPLTIKEADGTFRLVGVVSWGIGCASGYPGVYARVTHFNEWITNFISNN